MSSHPDIYDSESAFSETKSSNDFLERSLVCAQFDRPAYASQFRRFFGLKL